MPTHGELVQEAKETVQEASITPGKITKLLNDGLQFVASKVLLPELESRGTFETTIDSYYAAIPQAWSFGRNLYSARTADGPIRVLPSIAHLLEKPGVDLDVLKNGELKYITTNGSKLVYTYCPSVITTVFCKFYIAPPKLVRESDIPTCIPEHLHSKLLVSYVLMNAYELKEDGAEGLRVNTNHYKNEFFEALESFDVSVKTGISEPELDRTTTWV